MNRGWWMRIVFRTWTSEKLDSFVVSSRSRCHKTNVPSRLRLSSCRSFLIIPENTWLRDYLERPLTQKSYQEQNHFKAWSKTKNNLVKSISSSIELNYCVYILLIILKKVFLTGSCYNQLLALTTDTSFLTVCIYITWHSLLFAKVFFGSNSIQKNQQTLVN